MAKASGKKQKKRVPASGARPAPLRDIPQKTRSAAPQQKKSAPPPRKPAKSAQSRKKTPSVHERKRAEERRREAERRAIPERRRAAKEKYRIKQKRKNFLAAFLSRLVLFLLVFSLLCGLTAGAFFAYLSHDFSAEKKTYTLLLGNDDNMRKISLDSEDVLIGGEPYINIDLLTEYLNLTVTGETDCLKYISRDGNNEYAEFTPEQTAASVNGVSVILSAKVIHKNQNYYIPFSFFETYLRGAEVSYDAGSGSFTFNRILLQSASSSVSAITTDQYEPLSFSLKSHSGLSALPASAASAAAAEPG